MRNESYNICEITNKNAWDDFVTSQPNHTFLHSWEWGEFNEAMGDKIFRIGIYNKNVTRNGGVTLIAAYLVIKVHARRGGFLFVPHGPILAKGEKIFNFQFSIFKLLTAELKRIAQQERVNFIRISPLLEDIEENKVMFKKLGFRDAPIHMHAETTWTLDLAPNEDELLMNMRKTTRNLTRRAIREGVEVKSGTSERDVEIFNNLYESTSIKHNFTPFNLTYLKNQVKIFTASDKIKIFTAYYKNEPTASAIIVFYGNSAFYHHGASSQNHPKIPATYLIQWEAIKEAKRRGHKFYNFWGIIKEENPSHPWSGITLFKKGFGGFQTDYLHAQDMPLSWKYWLNFMLETVRRIRRRL